MSILCFMGSNMNAKKDLDFFKTLNSFLFHAKQEFP